MARPSKKRAPILICFGSQRRYCVVFLVNVTLWNIFYHLYLRLNTLRNPPAVSVLASTGKALPCFIAMRVGRMLPCLAITADSQRSPHVSRRRHCNSLVCSATSQAARDLVTLGLSQHSDPRPTTRKLIASLSLKSMLGRHAISSSSPRLQWPCVFKETYCRSSDLFP